LVGRQEGHLACKKLDVGLLVVMILLELCTTYSCSPVGTTTSIILCFNKLRLTQVHLENCRQNGERITMSLKRTVFEIFDVKNAATLKTRLGVREGH